MQSGKSAIVIGAGFGGLAAAARLASHGWKVTIFDKRDQLGGRGYQQVVDGFKFDSGPTVITAPYMFDEIWELSGRRREDYFELEALDPFYRIFHADGRYFDYRHNTEDMLAEIERWNPADRDGYLRFIAHVTRVFESFHPNTDRPFHKLTKMLGIMPDVIRMGLFQPMYGYTSRWIKDPFLRQVFSFHPLLVGGSPFDTPSIYALIVQFEKRWGVHYAKGGTGAIVDAFGRLLGELGARVHLSSEVDQILIENRRAVGVRLKDGTVHRADVVISNADAAFTHMNLIPSQYRNPVTTARFKTMDYSSSLVVIYFGTKRRYLDSKLAHHNIILGRDYRNQLRSIFGTKHLSDDLSLYLHMPSRSDPTIAPEGCESFYVLALVPNLAGKTDWSVMARPFRDRVMQVLEDNYLPDLQANIVAERMIDPLHFRDTLNSYKGAAFAAKPTLMQSAWFRPHTKSSQFHGLYYVGASTHPGAGVPAVLSSGKIAANLILEQGS